MMHLLTIKHKGVFFTFKATAEVNEIYHIFINSQCLPYQVFNLLQYRSIIVHVTEHEHEMKQYHIEYKAMKTNLKPQ